MTWNTIHPLKRFYLCQSFLGTLTSIGPSLLAIVNSSLRQGYVPSYFKHTKVIPLFKKNNLDVNSVSNYHPILKLPFIGKVLEKVVEFFFLSLLGKLQVAGPFQSSFQKQNSIMISLWLLIQEIILYLCCLTSVQRLTQLTTIFCLIGLTI